MSRWLRAHIASYDGEKWRNVLERSTAPDKCKCSVFAVFDYGRAAWHCIWCERSVSELLVRGCRVVVAVAALPAAVVEVRWEDGRRRGEPLVEGHLLLVAVAALRPLAEWPLLRRSALEAMIMYGAFLLSVLMCR